MGGEDAAAACALAFAANRSLREGRSVAVRAERDEAGVRYVELPDASVREQVEAHRSRAG